MCNTHIRPALTNDFQMHLLMGGRKYCKREIYTWIPYLCGNSDIPKGTVAFVFVTNHFVITILTDWNFRMGVAFSVGQEKRFTTFDYVHLMIMLFCIESIITCGQNTISFFIYAKYRIRHYHNHKPQDLRLSQWWIFKLWTFSYDNIYWTGRIPTFWRVMLPQCSPWRWRQHGNLPNYYCHNPEDQGLNQKVKVELFLCLTQYHTIKTYAVLN